MVIRTFHLYRVREALVYYISDSMGDEFTKPPTLNLGAVFKDSDPVSPLIFVIMPGIDPQDEIITVANSMDCGNYLKSYSLGRGRGNGAEALIQEGMEKGFWILLQNCHLSLSWMPRLEYIVNNMNPAEIHPRFKLCLVTMSSNEFPIGILYQGTKLIYEIPKGMRENVMRIYSQISSDEYDNSEIMTQTEKRLIFNLAFFHAIVLERLQFGSIGWNIPYEFNPSDFAISRKHLRTFLLEYNEENTNSDLLIIPFEALSYVIGELNYGGRVTDRWDRRLLLSLLRKFFSRNSTFNKVPSQPLPDNVNNVNNSNNVDNSKIDGNINPSTTKGLIQQIGSTLNQNNLISASNSTLNPNFNQNMISGSNSILNPNMSQNFNQNISATNSNLNQVHISGASSTLNQVHLSGANSVAFNPNIISRTNSIAFNGESNLSQSNTLINNEISISQSNFQINDSNNNEEYINYEEDNSYFDDYILPDWESPLEQLIETVNKWPVVTSSLSVGLSQNASTITARKEAMSIFSSLIDIQPSLVAISEAESEEEYGINLVESIQMQLPKEFNLHLFEKKFSTNDTMNTVLHHELLLYNELLKVIRESLEQMEKGLKGLILINII